MPRIHKKVKPVVAPKKVKKQLEPTLTIRGNASDIKKFMTPKKLVKSKKDLFDKPMAQKSSHVKYLKNKIKKLEAKKSGKHETVVKYTDIDDQLKSVNDKIEYSSELEKPKNLKESHPVQWGDPLNSGFKTGTKTTSSYCN